MDMTWLSPAHRMLEMRSPVTRAASRAGALIENLSRGAVPKLPIGQPPGSGSEIGLDDAEGDTLSYLYCIMMLI